MWIIILVLFSWNAFLEYFQAHYVRFEIKILLRARLHVPSPCHCPSKSPSKYNTVPMVMDRLTDRWSSEPILSININLTVTVTDTGDGDGTCKWTQTVMVMEHLLDNSFGGGWTSAGFSTVKSCLLNRYVSLHIAKWNAGCLFGTGKCNIT